MGLLTSLWDDEILERGETRRDGDELFRVKVVGSTPAGPTINIYVHTEKKGDNFLFTVLWLKTLKMGERHINRQGLELFGTVFSHLIFVPFAQECLLL